MEKWERRKWSKNERSRRGGIITKERKEKRKVTFFSANDNLEYFHPYASSVSNFPLLIKEHFFLIFWSIMTDLSKGHPCVCLGNRSGVPVGFCGSCGLSWACWHTSDSKQVSHIALCLRLKPWKWSMQTVTVQSLPYHNNKNNTLK